MLAHVLPSLSALDSSPLPPSIPKIGPPLILFVKLFPTREWVQPSGESTLLLTERTIVCEDGGQDGGQCWKCSPNKALDSAVDGDRVVMTGHNLCESAT